MVMETSIKEAFEMALVDDARAEQVRDQTIFEENSFNTGPKGTMKETAEKNAVDVTFNDNFVTNLKESEDTKTSVVAIESNIKNAFEMALLDDARAEQVRDQAIFEENSFNLGPKGTMKETAEKNAVDVTFNDNFVTNLKESEDTKASVVETESNIKKTSEMALVDDARAEQVRDQAIFEENSFNLGPKGTMKETPEKNAVDVTFNDNFVTNVLKESEDTKTSVVAIESNIKNAFEMALLDDARAEQVRDQAIFEENSFNLGPKGTMKETAEKNAVDVTFNDNFVTNLKESEDTKASVVETESNIKKTSEMALVDDVEAEQVRDQAIFEENSFNLGPKGTMMKETAEKNAVDVTFNDNFVTNLNESEDTKASVVETESNIKKTSEMALVDDVEAEQVRDQCLRFAMKS
ncbi:hypothetical protein KIN20_009771 [Parelaphostrongylus tenuis]|uniref:Uncharacterized protein n=1 Tax=Parelaphostrongylus tenuis TaxID=148309 RepID=A0AAD5MBL9_PARTN|nr:hypothetical protein KIN20_009771 [Parelaphostrongylus tenuis]